MCRDLLKKKKKKTAFSCTFFEVNKTIDELFEKNYFVFYNHFIHILTIALSQVGDDTTGKHLQSSVRGGPVALVIRPDVLL